MFQSAALAGKHQQLTPKLIFDVFIKRFENNKIYFAVRNAVDCFLELGYTA